MKGETYKRNAASSVVIKEIADKDVAAAAAFLHEHMNSQIPESAWRSSLETNWVADAPNHGFILKDGDQIVGVLCAIYSDQLVNGKLEKFCNPHSWCVLPDYRAKSVQLVLSVIKQKGYHFTMFSPNEEGREIFSFLKFKPMDNTIVIYPTLSLLAGKTRIIEDAKEAIKVLPEDVRKVFQDHVKFPWLTHFIFGSEGRYGLLFYKKETLKRLPCAYIIYVSDPELFHECLSGIKRHFLISKGIFTNKIESRLLTKPVGIELGRKEGHQKYFLSTSLAEQDIQNIYGELVALDL